MIVIAIIGILAAIAIPQFIAYRARGYSASANSAVRNAYTAAQAFFSDSPGGAVANELALSSYGYRIDANVPINVATGTINSITLSATNAGGGSTFTVDANGSITRS
jgi:type II secretory pathway pseudopilin PulG